MTSTELLTVSEVARLLRVDDTTVRRWIKNGAFPAINLPSVGFRDSYRIRRSDVDTVLNGGTVALQDVLEN
jgi:excisionase family DNA binding protein